MFLLLLAFANPAWSLSVEDVPNPRAANRWVSDVADVFSAPEEVRLDKLIDALHTDLGVEIAVVTVETVDTPTPKAFATELFNTWGIGDARSNNGLLVLLVLSERRLEMETGYGLEGVLSDRWLKSMQESQMVPAFKQGAFGRGIEGGIVAVDDRLRRNAGGESPTQWADDGPSKPSDLFILGTVGSIPILLTGLVLVRKRKRRIERTCPSCQIEMPLLDETEDDAHLEEGQQTEEALGSIDYRVHICSRCGFHRVTPNRKWFSG